MPIYEYNCLDCKANFEYLVRSSNETVLCPNCKQMNLKRLISVFSFSSKDASGNIASSSSSCSTCSSHNCSSCSG